MAQTARSVAEVLAARVARGDLPPGASLPAVRELARTQGCSPGTAARALTLLRRAGVATGPARSRATVPVDGAVRAAVLLAGDTALRLAGSDDPALDVVLRATGSRVTAGGTRGSVHGLKALATGTADAATVHLRTTRGRATDDFAVWALAGDEVRVVHLWRRTQGLVVPAGNPLGIRTVTDLAGRRVAWRNPGSGTRLLLERLLAEAGVEVRAAGDAGAQSHLAVAVAVATGAADAGMAVAPAAAATGTEWVPLVEEAFELVVGADVLPRVQVLLDALASTPVHRRLDVLPGYDLRRTGEVRVPA